MDVDGHVERLGSGEEGPVGFVVIEDAGVVVVDQGADEAELLDAAGQLVGCGWRVRDTGTLSELALPYDDVDPMGVKGRKGTRSRMREGRKLRKVAYSTVAQPPKRVGCFWIAAAKTLLESMA